MHERLLTSAEPSIRLLARTRVLGEEPAPELLEQVRASERAEALRRSGLQSLHPYAKWAGAHWSLVMLAEIGYPPGDEALVPLREHVLGWLLSDRYEERWVPPVHGRSRLHASQDANAVWALLRLGLADRRIDRLVQRLIGAQWPDGGWNCDPREAAHVSSFEETLIPLRALALHGGDAADEAASRAAEVLLERKLFRRRSDGQPIAARFVQLHFPTYWHYDLLFALKVIAEAGYIGDPRCADAFELLESKRLPDGGFPAEARYYRGSSATAGRSPVDWGGTSKRHANEWVTVDALAVLSARDAKRPPVGGPHAAASLSPLPPP